MFKAEKFKVNSSSIYRANFEPRRRKSIEKWLGGVGAVRSTLGVNDAMVPHFSACMIWSSAIGHQLPTPAMEARPNPPSEKLLSCLSSRGPLFSVIAPYATSMISSVATSASYRETGQSGLRRWVQGDAIITVNRDHSALWAGLGPVPTPAKLLQPASEVPTLQAFSPSA